MTLQLWLDICLESLSHWVQSGGVCCARVSGSWKQTSPAGQCSRSLCLDLQEPDGGGGFGGGWQGDWEQFVQLYPHYGSRQGWYKCCPECRADTGEAGPGVSPSEVGPGVSPSQPDLLCVPFTSWSLPVAWGDVFKLAVRLSITNPIYLKSFSSLAGSPGQMSCPGTGAPTQGSNPTSVQCVRRSLLAVTTCPSMSRCTGSRAATAPCAP